MSFNAEKPFFYINFSSPNTTDIKKYKWPARRPKKKEMFSLIFLEFIALLLFGKWLTGKLMDENLLSSVIVTFAAAILISALTAVFATYRLKQSIKKKTLQMEVDLKLILGKILESGWELSESTMDSFVRNRGSGHFVNKDGIEYRFKNLWVSSSEFTGIFKLIDEKALADIESHKTDDYADWLYTMWEAKHGSMTDVELEKFREVVALAVDNISEID